MSGVGGSFWAADQGPKLIERSIGGVLATRASADADRVAVLWEHGAELRRLTWSELHAVAACGARWLLERTRPGARVAVWAPNQPAWVILEYANALAGTVLVPLNPALVDAECAYLLESSAATLLFTVPDSAGRPLLSRADRLAPRLPALTEVVSLEPWAADLAAAAPADHGRLPEVGPDDPFLVQFTSGTTGRPKGALISHLAAFNSAWMSARALRPTDDEVWCAGLPLHHVGGSVSVLLGALSVRGAYVVVPDATVETLLRLLERTRATHTGFVPTVLRRLVEHPRFAEADLGALRTMMGGGASVPAALVRELESRLGATVLIGYGQSESVSISQTAMDDTPEVKATSIGRPLPHREVCVQRLGRNAPGEPAARNAPGKPGELADRGEVGEICTRSRLTMSAYLRRPEADADVDAEVFDSDGWLHTGDLASMDEHGVLTFHGRAREVIIRGGENIYPREVEEALLGHPEIAEVAVVGMPDDVWGETVAAFVRLSPGSGLAEAELRRYAREVLAPFKVPVLWRTVEQFPLTASQKIRKNVLRDELVAATRGGTQGETAAG